jgi:hypothetical protein
MSLRQDFVADGYRLPELLRRIATSPAFYRVTPPKLGFLENEEIRQ